MRPMQGELLIHADAEALAREGAADFGRLAREAITRRGRFGAVLTGGSSPLRLYQHLADPGATGDVDWASVHLFWGDERMVPPGHPRSNYRMAARAFLRGLPIPRENVHRIRGELPVTDAVRILTAELDRFLGDGSRFDLIHLGLGGDGHVASLFPFDREVLLERRRNASPALLRSEGEWRATMTMPVLRRARRVEFLLPDAAKGMIARRAMHGPLDPVRIPAQGVRVTDGSLYWRLTRDVMRAARLT